MDDMYNSYTCGGINQLYFCLKNGFENIKPIVGEDAPLDEYGLSMLSVIVNGEGELAYCTCRWNHDNGGNDSIMSAVEISDIVNVDFYETFKPSNIKWEDVLDNVKNRLSKGESIEDVFDMVNEKDDDIYMVKLSDKFNFVNREGEILLDTWFDEINYGKFDDYNRTAVKLNNKWNVININNGEYLLDKWVDHIGYNINGGTIVELNSKCNILNADCKYLLDKWVEYKDLPEEYKPKSLFIR
jgi:hypothetical protein